MVATYLASITGRLELSLSEMEAHVSSRFRGEVWRDGELFFEHVNCDVPIEHPT